MNHRLRQGYSNWVPRRLYEAPRHFFRNSHFYIQLRRNIREYFSKQKARSDWIQITDYNNMYINYNTYNNIYNIKYIILKKSLEENCQKSLYHFDFICRHIILDEDNLNEFYRISPDDEFCIDRLEYLLTEFLTFV